MKTKYTIPFLTVFFVGCASFMQYKDAPKLAEHKEFEQALQVKELPTPIKKEDGTVQPSPSPTPEPTPEPKGKKKKKTKEVKKPVEAAPRKPQKHLPAIEDPEEFDPMSEGGRRPLKDPFRVNEKVTMEVSYFAITAGQLTIEVLPFVEVNGRKSYKVKGTAKSYGMFSSIYVLDDWFDSFLDYERLVPYTYSLHVKESKQLREVRNLFDWNKKMAFFWEKKVNSEGNLEERKKEWAIPEYSQNVFTAAWYMRVFKLTPGKKLAFKIAHEGEVLTYRFEVLRKEKLDTDAGEFDTVVVKPSIEIEGVFKPMGDIFFWFTDDDRKLLVKFESKLKIGSLKAVATKIERGDEP